MSFLTKLKKMFKATEEHLLLAPQHAIQHLEDAEKKLENEFEDTLSRLSERFDKESHKTRKNITRLQGGELLNTKVEKRHLQIMEGNRDAYVKKVEQFIHAVDNRQPIKKEHAPHVKTELEEKLERLLKSTQKAYFVLQEFLANESRAIAGNLKMFDSLLKELDREIEEQEKLLARLGIVKTTLSRLDKQPGREDKLREAAEAAEAEAESAEAALERYRRGKEYKEFKSLKKTWEHLESECDTITHELSQHLSVIERAMRKYHKICLEPKIVAAVLDAPMRLLLLEPERLATLLPKLELSILSDELMLKQRKREKSLKAIAYLIKEMPSLTKKFSRLEGLREEAESELSDHTAEENEKRFSRTAEETTVKARLCLEELENFLETTGKPLDSEIQKLEEELASLLGRRICLELE